MPDESKATKKVILRCVDGQWEAKFVDSPEFPISQIDMNRFPRVILRGFRLYRASKRTERKV